jgi:hypothetical protein
MSIKKNSWLQNLRSALAPSRGQRNHRRRGSPRAATHRLNLELLEDRRLLAFIGPVHYDAAGPYNWDVKAGDFNGDAVLDLATANFGDNVSVLLGNPDGTFQPAQSSAAGGGPRSVAVGDFDKDGKLDLVAGNYYNYCVCDNSYNSDISILLGNGDGTFAPAIPLTFTYWPGNSSGVVTGDLNADGNLDVVATSSYNYFGQGVYPDGYKLTVLLGHGDGSFAPAVQYGFPNVTGWIGEPVLADFNGDGNADVAVPDYNSVNLFLGTSDGTLQTPRDIVTEGYGGGDSVAVADFDADGNLDLARTNSTSDSVSVVRGNGDGSFQTAQSFAAGDGARSVTASDVNGDGVPDLVVSATGASPSYEATVNVLLGNGDGSFALPIATAAPDGGSVVLADFNADGRPDATVVNMGLLVLINDGNWSLPPPPPPPSISIHDATVTEGNTGSKNATFTIMLSAGYNRDVTVHYATANITAVAGSDYTAASGDVIIPAGQTSRTLTIAVKGDRLAEPTETFAVNLSAPANATIGDGQGVGTILDNEPRISISDFTRAEGKNGKTTTFTFTVTLSAAYDQAVTMSYRTVNGTATTGDGDYVAKTGTLTFAPGQTSKTITIEVKGDSKRESNELFYLDLFGLSSNSLFTKNRGIGTILNDD